MGEPGQAWQAPGRDPPTRTPAHRTRAGAGRGRKLAHAHCTTALPAGCSSAGTLTHTGHAASAHTHTLPGHRYGRGAAPGGASGRAIQAPRAGRAPMGSQRGTPCSALGDGERRRAPCPPTEQVCVRPSARPTGRATGGAGRGRRRASGATSDVQAGTPQLRGWRHRQDSLGGTGRAPGWSAVPVLARCCPPSAAFAGWVVGRLPGPGPSLGRSRSLRSERLGGGFSAMVCDHRSASASATIGGSRKRRGGGGLASLRLPTCLLPVPLPRHRDRHAVGQGAHQHRERRRSGSRSRSAR